MFSLMKRDFDLMTVLNWQNFQGSVLPVRQERATICDVYYVYTETVLLTAMPEGQLNDPALLYVYLLGWSIQFSSIKAANSNSLECTIFH